MYTQVDYETVAVSYLSALTQTFSEGLFLKKALLALLPSTTTAHIIAPNSYKTHTQISTRSDDMICYEMSYYTRYITE